MLTAYNPIQFKTIKLLVSLANLILGGNDLDAGSRYSFYRDFHGQCSEELNTIVCPPP